MQVQEELEQARQDALYVQANRDALLREYPERWIAVLDGRLVASAEEFHDLLAQIDDRGVSRRRVYFEFLTTDEAPLVPTLNDSRLLS
jgi:hypothetical protein